MTDKPENFFNINDKEAGNYRKLGEGLTSRLFPGDQAMISVVRIEPNAEGTLHHHEEEQWGFLVEGSALRTQGDEQIKVKAGGFWRTPSNVPHTIKAGPDGAVVFDVFAPPRKAYLKPARDLGSKGT